MFVQFRTANHQASVNECWQLPNKVYYHILILGESKICILYTYLALIIRNGSGKVGLPFVYHIPAYQLFVVPNFPCKQGIKPQNIYKCSGWQILVYVNFQKFGRYPLVTV